ncbi:hypothetical protein I6F48_03505 [Pseudoalteromonas sp. SWYJ118]|uniref:hypothetical protein n=1 Tax=Pseudoalteromonas sp. SWYJ118 TaxID=2792062 RepID=UPI0018CE8D68|nr:hypothetical protein [Pseudoalteromonas sp. SWYJ118]MBH0074629.1 hypothetical protein [Pseudoalteromonas sp. SWYJ118]
MDLILKFALPLISTLIATIAIYFTWQQSKSNKRHNELSVRPAICSNINLHVEAFTFSITNKGLGPAKVDEFKFFYDDELIGYENFEKIINEKFQAYCAYKKPPITSTQKQNSYIAQGETIIILELQFDDRTSQQSKNEIENEITSKLTLEFEYTSLYDETVKEKFKFSTKN